MTTYEVLQRVSKDFEKSNDLPRDVVQFLKLHDQLKTAQHSGKVAKEAKRLATRFGENEESAMTAAWLHDISAIFPNEERIAVARELELLPLPEEEKLPLIIHQRISEVMAKEIFGVTSIAILSAIGCHTTLKKDASNLDKVVFVADKIQWDQDGNPPYLDRLVSALEISLDMAALAYLEYMWERRENLVVVHPWLKEAYLQLAKEK